MLKGKQYLESKRRVNLKNPDLDDASIHIRVTNPSPYVATNVDIFDSYSNRFAANFNLPNTTPTLPPLPQNQMTAATFGTSGSYTYEQVLANSEEKAYVIGRIMLVVYSGDVTQLQNALYVFHRTDTGDVLKRILNPPLDPYQSKQDRMIFDKEIDIDGYTGIQFSQFQASTILDLYIYMKSRFSAPRLL